MQVLSALKVCALLLSSPPPPQTVVVAGQIHTMYLTPIQLTFEAHCLPQRILGNVFYPSQSSDPQCPGETTFSRILLGKSCALNLSWMCFKQQMMFCNIETYTLRHI